MYRNDTAISTSAASDATSWVLGSSQLLLTLWMLGSSQLLLTLWVLGSSHLLMTLWVLRTIRVDAVPSQSRLLEQV